MITINDKEYQFKYTLRALFIFEQITKKPFSISTLLDNYLFFYCILLANNSDVLEWDEFIDALDKDPSLLSNINEALAEHEKLEELFSDKEDSKEEKKS